VTSPLSNRRVDVFFYGLFMDESVLRKSGVTPCNPRRACVADFAPRIGQRATLVPSKGAMAFGMLMALTHADLDVLYDGPGLEHYKPEAVLARTLEGLLVPALCFNLPEAPNPVNSVSRASTSSLSWIRPYPSLQPTWSLNQCAGHTLATYEYRRVRSSDS
jgi:hypothetical protein